MIKCLIILTLLIHASSAQTNGPEADPQPDQQPVEPTGSLSPGSGEPEEGGLPAKKWPTLSGLPPLVIARGGFSGVFPESSEIANKMALNMGIPDMVMFCNLQLTKDGVGLCLSDIRLDNTTTIAMMFPKDQKTYNVNGQSVRGWFASDYASDTIFNVSLIQSIYSRTNIFDGVLPISTVQDVVGQKPQFFWLSVQNDLFYTENKLSVTTFIQDTIKTRVMIDYVSSPELNFLKSIGTIVDKKTRLVFEFKASDAKEPTTNKTYGEILKDLDSIKQFASGILVPKDYIWPVDANRYLKPATTLVNDAHKAGLEVYASGFANDYAMSYNYSYDPVLEYLQFVNNTDFSVDGLLTDFPTTAAEVIECFAKETSTSPKIGNALIISHDGASGDYPGSTDLAYQKAVTDGADVIDCSVQMSKDGTAFCLNSADLSPSTTAMTTFMSQVTNVPEIQNTSGVFSFDLSWTDIQSLKPQISTPYGVNAGFPRNPANKNAGKLMTLDDFLKFSKEKAVGGVLVKIENAAYLASKKGLDVIGSIKKALSSAALDKTQVFIESDDSSVLSSFKDAQDYKRVLRIKKIVSGVPKEQVEEIKKYADTVNVERSSLIATADGFAVSRTKVAEDLHAANISVFVSVLRNEFISIAFDYFSDPTVQFATFIAGTGVDGVVTDFPATANRYMRSICSDLNQNFTYPILPAEPGGLLSAAPAAQAPAPAPRPALTSEDIIDPPLPAVNKDAKASDSTPGSGDTPAGSPKSSGVTIGARLSVSLMSITMVLGLLRMEYY